MEKRQWWESKTAIMAGATVSLLACAYMNVSEVYGALIAGIWGYKMKHQGDIDRARLIKTGSMRG